MAREKVPQGTPVTYWGKAKSNSLYGTHMTVKWANVCNCKHQTYALQYTDAEGVIRTLEQVLETSFTVRQVDE